jgi:hypothetical protein
VDARESGVPPTDARDRAVLEVPVASQLVSDLLETVIEAHGGLERRNQIGNVSARLTKGATVLEALDQPRASFAGYALETPWSTLQLAYFVGTAMWTDLTQPFTFTLPGFQTRELEPWDEAGRRRRGHQAPHQAPDLPAATPTVSRTPSPTSSRSISARSRLADPGHSTH